MYIRIVHNEGSGAVNYLPADLTIRECVLVNPTLCQNTP